MSLDDRTSSLVESIYASIDDRVAWTGVLDSMLDRTGSALVLVSAVDVRAGTYSETQWHGPAIAHTAGGIREYEEEMFLGDPTLAFGIAHPSAGRVGLREQIMRQGRDPASDPYVRWLRSRLGVDDSIVRYTPPTNGLMLGMSLHAPAAVGTHARESVDLFLMLFEHVERAMRVAIRPPDFTSDTAVVVMVARDGRIVRASPAALALFDARDGLAIAEKRLVAASRGQSKRLDAAIGSALGALVEGGAGTALALPRPSGRPDLLVRVDPLPRPPSPFEAFRPAALVTVTEPDAVGIAPDAGRRWAALFGLTPAEVRLTAALLDDNTGVRTVAERLGISYETARVHLARIFDKVGVRSQAQLARLLTRLGAWVAALWPAIDQAASMLA